MIADIIPITKLPRGVVDTFSYIVPAELEEALVPGIIVTIPLRNKTVQGVVKALKKKSAEDDLKTVIDVVFPLPLITSQQLQIARFVAHHALTSLSSSIRLCVPNIPKTKLEQYADRYSLPKVVTRKESPPTTLVAPDPQQGIPAGILEKIQLAVQNNEQVLYMVPERIRLERIIELLHAQGIDNILVWEDATATHQRFSEYLNVRSNNTSVIIGTRSALFAPFAHLTEVFMEDEYNESYKSDQTPRYHTRSAIQELANIHGAQLTFVSRVPSVELYTEYQGNIKTLKHQNNISIVDIREEHKKKNYSVLSEELGEQVIRALTNKKRAFLFLNRRGHSTSIRCEDCGYIMNCPDCDLPYTFHANNYVQCHHCRKKNDIPPLCPKCSGPNIKLMGKGTQKVELDVQKIFPNANIIRVDSDSLPNYELRITNYDITIGTEFALSRIDWTDIAVVGVINTDTALYRPDFRSGERTFQLLHQLQSYAPDNAHIILQTYTPDHYVLQSIGQNKPELFYKKETDLRKALGYPPYRSAIKLIFRHTEDKKGIGEAMHMYHRLRKHLIRQTTNNLQLTTDPKTIQPIDVIRPFPGHPKKSAGRYQFNLILRVDNQRKNFVIEQLQTLLSPGWVIDTDPETLL